MKILLLAYRNKISCKNCNAENFQFVPKPVTFPIMKLFIELCSLISTLGAAEAFIRPTLINAHHNTQLFVPEDKFFYFAYGSNLFEPRIHIRNPSAELYDIAKLPVSLSTYTTFQQYKMLVEGTRL